MHQQVCVWVIDTVCLHFRHVASVFIWSMVDSVSRGEFSGLAVSRGYVAAAAAALIQSVTFLL